MPHSPETGSLLGISMGDPAGIGPEITLKAGARLAEDDPAWYDRLELHGDLTAFEALDAKITRKGEVVRVNGFRFISSSTSSPARAGQPTAETGAQAFLAIQSVLSRIHAGALGGIITAPISKWALNQAGYHYPGHTEVLSEAAGNIPVRMMLANDELAVVLVTVHQPLREAIDTLTTERIEETIRISDRHFRRMGRSRPALAVAGLNPHAGEEGLLGTEERSIIEPAIARCRADGIDVSGPFPPDTIFMLARRERCYDAVIAQYHDQGLIPVKYLGVERGVNVTLGLPFVRTSPDHGTAFDIAGQGKADAGSMVAAIERADALLRGKQ